MFPSIEFWFYVPAGIVAMIVVAHAVFAALTYLQDSVTR